MPKVDRVSPECCFQIEDAQEYFEERKEECLKVVYEPSHKNSRLFRYILRLDNAYFYLNARIFPITPFFDENKRDIPSYIQDLPKNFTQRSKGEGSFTKARIGVYGPQNRQYVWKKTLAKSLLNDSLYVLRGQFKREERGLALPIGYCPYVDLKKNEQKVVYLEECYDGDLKDPSLFHDIDQSIRALVSIFQDVLYGLQALHQKNHWHRDIKCTNIFYQKIGEQYRGFLGDWDMLNQWGTAGTPPFLAPEVIENGYYSSSYCQGDIWATGLTILKILNRIFPSKNTSSVYRWSFFKQIWKSQISMQEKQAICSLYRDLDLDNSIKDHYARIQHGKSIIDFHVRRINSEIATLSHTKVKKAYQDVIVLIERMLNVNRHERPTAKAIYEAISRIEVI